MAPPPKLKRLRPEDYDFEAPPSEWGPKLLEVLTQFCGDVSAALTGQVSYGENIRSEEREIRVQMPSGSGSADAAPYPLFLKPQRALQPRNMVVTHVKMEATTGSPITFPTARSSRNTRTSPRN